MSFTWNGKPNSVTDTISKMMTQFAMDHGYVPKSIHLPKQLWDKLCDEMNAHHRYTHHSSVEYVQYPVQITYNTSTGPLQITGEK